MNRRRILIALLGFAALASTDLLARAPARPHRVTHFAFFPSQEAMAQTRQLWLARFSEHGFVEKRDFALALVDANVEREQIERKAREVVASRPDVICVPGSEWTLMFMRLTREIPIVFYSVADPVRTGLVASFSRPGGNVTGVTNRYFELQGKRLELLKELRPEARRIAVLHPAGPTVDFIREEMESASERLGVKMVLLVLPALPAPDVIIAALRKANVQGAVFTFGTEVVSEDLLRYLERSALPAVFSDNTLVAAGGLASLGEKRPGHGTRAVDLAVRVLRGEKPATIPVDQLAKFHLAINLRTAKSMGLKVPESIRMQADQVIE